MCKFSTEKYKKTYLIHYLFILLLIVWIPWKNLIWLLCVVIFAPFLQFVNCDKKINSAFALNTSIYLSILAYLFNYFLTIELKILNAFESNPLFFLLLLYFHSQHSSDKLNISITFELTIGQLSSQQLNWNWCSTKSTQCFRFSF